MIGRKTLLISFIAALLHAQTTLVSASSIKDNVLTFLRIKKQYTPLLYFTVPKNEYESCNKMDKIVSEVEKELKVKIQKHNVRKNVHHSALRQMIGDNTGAGGGTSVPFLYHRESRQTIRGVTSKEKVRAWAKGRWVESSLTLEEGGDDKKEKKEPPIDAMGIEDDEEPEGNDAFSLMEVKGKKAMREKALEQSKKK